MEIRRQRSSGVCGKLCLEIKKICPYPNEANFKVSLIQARQFWFSGVNSTLNFRDPTATNLNRRFYRAVVP
jgi:hypothetical protein